MTGGKTSHLILGVVLFLAVHSCGGTIILFNETIEEPIGFNCTPLLGNPSVYQEWLDWCVADEACAEDYGQSKTQDLSTFIHLVQIAKPFGKSPSVLCLESALIEKIWGMFLEEIMQDITVDELKLSISKSGVVCGLNEIIRFNNETNTTKCIPKPASTPTDSGTVTGILIFILVATVILLIMGISYELYTIMIKSSST
jgi:hypothetical protein